MAGYSGTPLQKKLGLKPGMNMYLLGHPREYFDWISPLPADVKIASKPRAQSDFIHLFVSDRNTFEKEFANLMKYLAKDGMMWVSWP